MITDSSARKNLPIWRIHALMVISSVLVSTSFTVGKAITEGLDPAILILIRFFLAAIIFLPYVKKNYHLPVPSLTSLFRYSIISGALVAFFWFMFFSLRYTSALNTGVIFTLVPGISGIYSAFLLKERLGIYRLTALVLAMTGAIIIIFHGNISHILTMQLNYGDLMFFCGCLFMALYTPLIKLFYRGEPMAVVTFWILITGCIWLLCLSVPTLADVSWQKIELKIWLGIFYLAVFCTIITFFLTQLATMYIGPTRVMAYSYLYPPMVILLNWFGGQPLPPVLTLTGVAIIIPSLIIVQIGAQQEHTSSLKNYQKK